MTNRWFGIIAIAMIAALPVRARASVQQPTPEQRREIERRMGELEQQMRELHRQLGDEGPRARTRVFGPQGNRMGGNGVFTIIAPRPKFGFTFETVSDSGVVVRSVTPESPAEKAGLKAGDVVTQFNGIALGDRDNAGDELRG